MRSWPSPDHGRGDQRVGFNREVGDTLVFMDGGIVVESGSPREILTNSRQERTDAFLPKVL